jgi:chemotaxis protein methyltransferase CheR
MNVHLFHLNHILNEIYLETGIVVSSANHWQVQKRIQMLCDRHNLSSFQGLRQHLNTHRKYMLWVELIECVLVQESYFFRDKNFFQQLERELLPQLLQHHAPIRIWSAAAAQGQEIYSIAMMAHKNNFLDQLELYASDISEKALHTAEQGLYSYAVLQRSISHDEITEFFQPKEQSWMLRHDIRKDIRFFQHNLIHPSGKFNHYHIIIIKNVLMYLSPEKRKQVIEYAYRALHEDGILVFSNPNTQILYKKNAL